MVWLPTPACVIVAVRLSKALRLAHKGAKQSARPCGPHEKPGIKTPVNKKNLSS